MRKFYLTAFVVAVMATCANAQYFQHLYGYMPQIGTIPGNGQFTTAIGPGHLVGGEHIDIMGFPLHQGNYGIHVHRTDPDGRFTTPNDFNNSYLLVNAGNNQQLRFTAAYVIEFDDASGYGAIGTYFEWDANWLQIIAQGIAYVRLDPNGNVMAVQGYQLDRITGGQPTITGLRESISTPGDMFATGVLNSNDGTEVFAMRIDQNGTLKWGELYDFASGFEDPKDLTESPYANELVIVGRYTEGWPGTTLEAGFWMVVDPNTGAFNKVDIIRSYYPNSDEFLHSIDISSDPIQGFIVAGASADANGTKAWVTKTYTTGGYMWSGFYWSATQPQKLMRGYDAVCREKTNDDMSHDYEYFVTGPYWSTYNDGDAFVFKLDRWGNPVNPNALFLYDYGVEETGLDVDVNTTGNGGDGIAMYAVGEGTSSSTREIYTVKAYFNGVSGCNEYFEDLAHQGTEFGAYKTLTATQRSFSYQNIQLSQQLNNIDNELCYNPFLSDGSNAMVAPAKPAGDKEAIISPNPMQQGMQMATVELEAENSTPVEVTIYDMLGKQYYSGKYTLVKGKNQLPVNLSETNMAAGMYTVRISGGGLNKNVLLMIKQ